MNETVDGTQVVDTSGTTTEGAQSSDSGGSVSDKFDMPKALDRMSEGLFGKKTETEGDTQVNATAQTKPAEIVANATNVPANTGTTAPITTAAVAPKTWSAGAQATWAQIPVAAQAEIAKREEDMFRGIEQYKAKAVRGDTFDQMLKPFEQVHKQFGIDPVKNVEMLLHAHLNLATGSKENKAALVRNLIRDYQVDMDLVTGSQTQASAFVDPQLKATQDELAAVKARQDSFDRRTQEENRKQIDQRVLAFATDPKNIYFNELGDDIARLISSGVCAELPEAYEKALWLNPAVRAKELARQDADKQALATKEANEKLEAARKAKAANLKSSPKAGTASSPLGSMDDTLRETLSRINSRH